MSGDIWDVPLYPQADFPAVPTDVWRACEPLLVPWPGKCQSACAILGRPYGPGWLDADTGRIANEIGAPVGQAVTVIVMRRRDPPAPAG